MAFSASMLRYSILGYYGGPLSTYSMLVTIKSWRSASFQLWQQCAMKCTVEIESTSTKDVRVAPLIVDSMKVCFAVSDV